MDSMNIELKDRINALETKQSIFHDSFEEKMIAIKITDEARYKSTQDQLAGLEESNASLSQKMVENNKKKR